MNKLIQKLLDSGIKNAAQEYQWLKDSAESEQQLSTWVDDRSKGKPLAYILGHVDFFWAQFSGKRTCFDSKV